MGRARPRLIETIRIKDGAAPLWYLHLRRLASSCKALGIPLPAELPTPQAGPDRVIRLEVGPRGVTRSERPVGSDAPVRLSISKEPHRPYPHKTTDREPFDRAQEEARAVGADDGILLTQGGRYLAETAIWAVCWWEGQELYGPALEIGILPGVGRARVVELAGGIRERRVPPEAVRGRSLFVVNAVRGILPVASLDGEPVPSDPRTRALASRFWT